MTHRLASVLQHGRCARSWPRAVLGALALLLPFVPTRPLVAQQPQIEVKERTLSERATAPDAERWLAIWAGQPGVLDVPAAEPVWLERWASGLRASWALGRPLPGHHALATVAPQWLRVGGQPLSSPAQREPGSWDDALCPKAAPRGARVLAQLTPVLADDVGRVALLVDLTCVHGRTALRRARARVEATAAGTVRSIRGVVVEGPLRMAEEPRGNQCTWPIAPKWDGPRRSATWLTGVPQRGWLAGWLVGADAAGGMRCDPPGSLPALDRSAGDSSPFPVALWHNLDGDPTQLILVERFADGARWPASDRPVHWQLGTPSAPGSAANSVELAMLRGHDDRREQVLPRVFVIPEAGPLLPAPLPLPAVEEPGTWQCEVDAQLPHLLCHWLGEANSALGGASFRLQWLAGRFQRARD